MAKKRKTKGDIEFVPLTEVGIPEIGQANFESPESYRQRQKENEGTIKNTVEKILRPARLKKTEFLTEDNKVVYKDGDGIFVTKGF